MAFSPDFSNQSFNKIEKLKKGEGFGAHKKKKSLDAIVAGHVRAVTNRGGLRWLLVAISGYLAFQTGRVVTEPATIDEIAEWLRSLNRPGPKGRPPKGIAVPLVPHPARRVDPRQQPKRDRVDPEMDRPQVKRILRRQPRPTRDPKVDLDPPDNRRKNTTIWAWFERRYGRGSVARYMRRQ